MIQMERRIDFARLAGGAALALCCACKSDSQVNPFYPEIVVTPAAVDFGGVVAEYTAKETVEVFNAGQAALKISDVRIEGDGEIRARLDAH